MQIEKAHDLTVWSAPGVFLWIPTAVHGFIAFEIVQLALEHLARRYDGFDGFGIFWHIAGVSVPIAIVIAMGWALIAIGKLRLPAREGGRSVGCAVLAGINVVAPVALYIALKGVL